MKILKTAIGRSSDSPYVIYEKYTNYPDSPFDLTGYTGTAIAYTPFKLVGDFASGSTAIQVTNWDDEDIYAPSRLIKASDIIVVGSATTARHTVSSVDDTTWRVSMTTTTHKFYSGEMVKCVWHEGAIDSSNVVVGKGGSVKNRISYDGFTQAITKDRVYPSHRYLLKLKPTGGATHEQFPNPLYYEYHINIADDGNATALA